MTKKNNKVRLFDIILQIIGVLANIEILYILLNISKFASFSSLIFVFINVFGILLLALINVGTIVTLKKKNPRFHYIVFALLSVLVVLTSTTLYVVYKLNSSVSQIIVEPTQKEEVSGVFITYDNTKITKIEDLANQTFGVIGDPEVLEGNSLAKKELENAKITVTYKEYDTYNDLFLGLISGDVKAVAVPSGYYDLFIANDGYEEFLDKTQVIYNYSEKVAMQSTTATKKDITKEPFSVLIMGNDGGRTDSIIVATFNPVTFKATLTSIARDSFVPIACYKDQQSDKLGHARFISRSCSIKTVENLLNIKLDFFVEVNFQGVVDIVNAMGGLLLNSPVEFTGQSSSETRGYFNVWIPQGQSVMNGEQVLAFARERHHMPGGDYQRQLNQQQIISVLLKDLMQNRDVNILMNILDAASKNTKTNMSLDQMLSLFNYSINAMSNSYVNSERILDIQGSRITGYGSTNYNEAMELPLWIYRLYNGAIEDNRNFILNNLKIDYEPSIPAPMEYDINWWVNRPVIYQEEYNETKIHDVIPDIMPYMLGTQDGVWTLEKVRTWASSRNIALTINEIKEGNSAYSESYVHNQVISQSVRYGIKTSKISNLTIGVIKKNLDCKYTENRVYDECKDIVEYFIDTKISDVQSWAKDNNVILNIEWIASDNSLYNNQKIGLVYTQAVDAYKKIPDNRVLGLQVFDYPYMSTLPEIGWTKAQVDTWAANLTSLDNIIYISVYDGTKAAGTVLNVAPVYIRTKFRTNDKITLTVSNLNEPALNIPTFTGETKSTLEAWYTTNGIPLTNITYFEETSPGNVGKIISINPNISGSSSYTKTQLLTQAVTVTVGK